MQLTPIDLFACGVRMLPDGQVFGEQRRMSGDIDGWTLATFHLESDADAHGDHWEIHPAGAELVAVLSGGIRMYLRPERPGDEEDSLSVGPGQAYVVPQNRWHRIELEGPTDLMSVTLRRDTRLERRDL
ncbi:cupin domain-containing protein [Nocardia sp. NPDC059228]|uniref:cupin domain-containing protein n=1 Tax=Nocardia sp. NPDC059228 TaxID=3346777 RepID=UPI003690761B